MDFITLAKNPVPSGAISGEFKADDGLKLRYARWDATRGPKLGTICLFQGRGEFIEKYFEVVANLRRRGYAVATMDWRGQGGSQRELQDPQKGHIRDFGQYDNDLVRFMKDIVLPDCPPPYVALAHSMGGNILLRNSCLRGSWFQRMVLTAPMLELAREKMPVPPGVARAVAVGASLLGLGRFYIPGGKFHPIELQAFEGNPLTHDKERFLRNRALIEAAPQYALGDPTMSWLRAAFRSMAELGHPDFPKKVHVPLLLVAAGEDTIVSTRRIEEFGLGLKVGTQLVLPRARHEILQETDDVRQRFWAAFDAYLGAAARAA